MPSVMSLIGRVALGLGLAAAVVLAVVVIGPHRCRRLHHPRPAARPVATRDVSRVLAHALIVRACAHSRSS